MTTKEEITSLVQSLTEGSFEAFEKLYYLYNGMLYNFVMRLSSGDAYTAEEMVQQTFIRIWETREKVNPAKSFISYLCTISRNMLMNRYEHQTVEYVYRDYLLKTNASHDYQTEETTDLKFLNEYILLLAEKLPPSRKEIFILSKCKGYSNKEIAEIMQISESTIATQLSLAVQFMRKQFAKHYDKFILLAALYLVNKV